MAAELAGDSDYDDSLAAGQVVLYDVDSSQEELPQRDLLSAEAKSDLLRHIQILERNAPPSAHILRDVPLTVLRSGGEFGETTRLVAGWIQTIAYLEANIVRKDEVNRDGFFDDEYNVRADKTLVINGERVAACRMIHANERGLLSLPTFDHFRPFTDDQLNLLMKVAGVKRLIDIRPEDIEEFSGLGMLNKTDLAPEQAEAVLGRPSERHPFQAVEALLFDALAQAVTAGRKVWVMNVEKRLYDRVARMAYERNMHVIGDFKAYMGAPTMPIAMNPLTVARDILKAGDSDPYHQKLANMLRASLQGADADKIPEDLRKLLGEQNVKLRYDSLRKRVAKGVASLDYVSLGLITAVTIARDLGVRSDPRFHGSFPVLSGIDLSTGTVYSQGMSKLFRGRTVPAKLAGAGVMVAFNMPTYLYLFYNSDGIPDRSLEYLGGFFAAGIAAEGVKRLLRGKRERELRQILKQEPNNHEPAAQDPVSGLLEPSPVQ